MAIEIKISTQLIRERAERDRKRTRLERLTRELEELDRSVTEQENTTMIEYLREYGLRPEDLGEIIPFWLEMKSDEQKKPTDEPMEDTTQW